MKNNFLISNFFHYLKSYGVHFFIAFSIYLFTFYLFPVFSNYFYCSELLQSKLTILNYDLLLKIQVSCDFEIYLKGFKNFNNIFELNYLYQGRPLYILSINLIAKILSFLFKDDSIIIYHFAVTLFQVFIFQVITFLVFKITNIEFKKNQQFSILFLVSLTPIIRYGLFDPSHQLLTIVSFLLSLYLFENKNNLIKRNSYILAFLIGVLFLMNKVFLVSYLVLLLSFNFENIKNEKNINPYHFLQTLIIFLIPISAYYIWIVSQGYVLYEAETEEYGHFIWLLYFSNGHIVHEGEWFCQSIPENFICYFQDTYKAIMYLMTPIIYTIIFKFYSPLKKKYLIKLNSLFFITLIYYMFWSLIGWYPPLRFNLYTLGFALTFILILIFIDLKDYKLFSILHLIGLIFYFLGLTHWNNPNIISYNFLVISGGIILFLNLFLQISKFKKAI